MYRKTLKAQGKTVGLEVSRGQLVFKKLGLLGYLTGRNIDTVNLGDIDTGNFNFQEAGSSEGHIVINFKSPIKFKHAFVGAKESVTIYFTKEENNSFRQVKDFIHSIKTKEETRFTCNVCHNIWQHKVVDGQSAKTNDGKEMLKIGFHLEIDPIEFTIPDERNGDINKCPECGSRNIKKEIMQA